MSQKKSLALNVHRPWRGMAHAGASGVAEKTLYYYKLPLVMLAYDTPRQGRWESMEFIPLNFYLAK